MFRRFTLPLIALLAPAISLAGPTSDPLVCSSCDDERITLERRDDAARADALLSRGKRSTRNIALADEVEQTFDEGGSTSAWQAVDGDESTSWRGLPGLKQWAWGVRFDAPRHIALIRLLVGDSVDSGVPAIFRWEARAPQGGRCDHDGPWVAVAHGSHNDHDDNTFVHGPKQVHARRQAFFTDIDACALRLVIDETDEGKGPVLREVQLFEGARSLTRSRGVLTSAPRGTFERPDAAIDGTYEHHARGLPGKGPWHIDITLRETSLVDRISLTLGYDAVTVAREGAPGRSYSGANLPVRYRVLTSHDDDPRHLVPVDEARPPTSRGAPLPLRRRLIKLATPRPVRLLRFLVDESTGPSGERDTATAAPVIREIGLYEASDTRPVISAPAFFSVDANPAALTTRSKQGAPHFDGLFARDAYSRLRRILHGFDADSRWPADASRRRDDGTGKYLEAIEGDDPLLSTELVVHQSPPPVLLLSGSLDWEFDEKSEPSPAKAGHHRWDVLAPATAPDHGMGQLYDVVQQRLAPLVGFCGGAQILALLEASPDGAPTSFELLDRVLLRNENAPIRGVLTREKPYERVWWSDDPSSDDERPLISFDPTDPLWGKASRFDRGQSLEIPTSHGDFLRESAFAGPLRRFKVTATSDFCREWVSAQGPEPTFESTTERGARCVRMVQAFRSIDPGYPVIGFQFHPEQRDLVRLAPGSPREARGDALNVVANAVSLSIDAYLRLYWPDA